MRFQELFSKSIHNISESIFIEISNEDKNVLVGCIYRHHSEISEFIEQYFEDALIKVSKEKNKICTLLGDYNVDLLQVGTHSDTCDFYDLLSANGFKPLIMQPTRVTSKTATLIDNIFVNDIETRSTG